jgi:LPPG:FO 2-phospho-L-lactate transferase
MMSELGMPATAAAVAAHYGDLIDGFVIDQADADITDDLRATGLHVHVANTIMESVEDRENLAREVLGLGAKMRDAGP